MLSYSVSSAQTRQKTIIENQIDSLTYKVFQCSDSAGYFRKNNNPIKGKFYDFEAKRWSDSVFTIYETYFPEEFCDYLDKWSWAYGKKERNFCALFRFSGKHDIILWEEN